MRCQDRRVVTTRCQRHASASLCVLGFVGCPRSWQGAHPPRAARSLAGRAAWPGVGPGLGATAWTSLGPVFLSCPWHGRSILASDLVHQVGRVDEGHLGVFPVSRSLGGKAGLELDTCGHSSVGRGHGHVSGKPAQGTGSEIRSLWVPVRLPRPPASSRAAKCQGPLDIYDIIRGPYKVISSKISLL